MSRSFRRAYGEMWEYLNRFPDATAEEIAALRQWVKDGNSPYENGDGVCGEAGYEMDYISAMRFWQDAYQEYLKDPEVFTEHWLSSCDENPTDFEEPLDDNFPF